LTTSDWLRARSAPGVAYFVGAAGRPSAEPDDLVEEIRGRVAAPPPPNPQPPFGPGDRVLITGGPFAGLEAIFEHRLSPAGRVRVFLQIVTQLLKVDLHVDQLRAPDGVG
jgi:transcriptional antiterminator RfaH